MQALGAFGGKILRLQRLQVVVSVLLEVLLLSIRRFLGLNKYLSLTKGICLPLPRPSVFEHITSGQECFASPGIFPLFFLCKALRGHVTERNTVPFFSLHQDFCEVALRVSVALLSLCEMQRGIKRDNPLKAALVFTS